MTTGEAVIRVVDDDTAHRAALTRLLRAAGFATRGYGSAGEYLLDESGREAPGCVLLDLALPGPSGLELHEALLRRGDAPQVIYLTGRGDIPSSVRAMKAGAIDFLSKPVDRTALLAAIREALARDAAVRSTHSRRRALEARYATLTPKECDVLARVVAGRLNKQVADELGMAERTVKSHRSRAMEKMRATSLAELVMMMSELRAPARKPGTGERG